jgi:hypothetical protein
MRPTAERVLCALHEKDGEPAYWTIGATVEELIELTEMTGHVVRARLCELRRIGLVESDPIKRSDRKAPRCVHRLTMEGYRRAINN